MTMTIRDAAALTDSFTATATLLADCFTFVDAEDATRCLDRIDKVALTLDAMARSSGGVEPYTFALLVGKLQTAIAARHIHMGG